MLVINILILFQISLCIIVFPFKTIKKNQNEYINPEKEEYNYTHFMNDYFKQLNYITIKIGSSPQEIKSILTYQDCGFKIGKSQKCLNETNYLSYYNRNYSSDFNYTNYYPFPIDEFDKNGNSAEDSIYAYTDLNLQNYKKFQKIGFYLGSDTNDSLCCIIGFKMDNSDKECSKINNIIRSFKSNNIIDNYQWVLQYINKDEGLLVIGANIKDLFSNYEEDKLFITNSNLNSTKYNWGFDIQRVVSGNDNYIVDNKITRGEIDNDLALIQGSSSYFDYIENNFFKHYFENKICIKYMWYLNLYFQYFVIECDKKRFSNKDIKNFPKLYLIGFNAQAKFEFDGNDLFTETKYKYFFNVIFSIYRLEYWILGKIFLKKYLTIINLEEKTIQVYLGKNITNNEKNMDNSENTQNNILIIIFIMIFLFCIFGLLCFLIGKNINKIRKKKANELTDDDYDYTPSNENNTINNIAN